MTASSEMKKENEVNDKTLNVAKELAAKVVALIFPTEFPTTHYELSKRVWEAFYLGEEYQRLREKEKEKNV